MLLALGVSQRSCSYFDSCDIDGTMTRYIEVLLQVQAMRRSSEACRGESTWPNDPSDSSMSSLALWLASPKPKAQSPGDLSAQLFRRAGAAGDDDCLG